MEGDRLLVLIDRLGAEHRKAAAHDGAVFLGRAGEAVVGSDFRHVAGDVDLGEVAVGGEDEDAFGLFAEGVGDFAVGGFDFGDGEISGADDSDTHRIGWRNCRTSNH